MYTQETQQVQLQEYTKEVLEEHPIVALFPLQLEEKEYTWPSDWSWSDDMITF